jgi:hypothetical protein
MKREEGICAMEEEESAGRGLSEPRREKGGVRTTYDIGLFTEMQLLSERILFEFPIGPSLGMTGGVNENMTDDRDEEEKPAFLRGT